MTFSRQDNTDGQAVESGDTPTRQLISKWRNAAWLRELEQKEESAGIKKNQGAFCPQLKCSNKLAIERVRRAPKIFSLLASFTWAKSKNPWLSVLVTLLNQSEWTVHNVLLSWEYDDPSLIEMLKKRLSNVSYVVQLQIQVRRARVTFPCNLSSESTLTEKNHDRVPGHFKNPFNPPDHRSLTNNEKKNNQCCQSQ